MSKSLDVMDGETMLITEVFKHNSLQNVVRYALNIGLTFDDLSVDSITKDGPWKSTEESTIPVAILYANSKEGPDHLIVQGPEDEKYHLLKYEWTP